VLVDCAAGKGKEKGTGVITALVLSLCGLPDAAVAREHNLADLGLAPRKEEIVQHLIQGEAVLAIV